MPEVTERTRIAAPLSRVWPLLSDPAAVASCIPGADLAPQTEAGVWRGAIRVRFGPTVAAFRGEATLDFDHDAHRCTIEGRGIDQRGASRALSSGVVTATAEGEETVLLVEGRFNVTGPLETFANAGGVHVARAILAEFASNIAKLAAEQGPPPEPTAQPPGPAMQVEPAPATAPSPPPGQPAAPEPAQAPPQQGAAPSIPPRPSAAAKEISGFRIAWLALLSWLRGLFSKGSN